MGVSTTSNRIVVKIKQIIITIVIMLILSALIYLFYKNYTFHDFTNTVEAFLSDKNKTMVYLIFFMIALIACTAFIPVSWIKLAGGLLLGFWPGFLLSWLAVNLGGFLEFYLCRTFGKDRFADYLKKKIKNDTFLNHVLEGVENKGMPLVMNLHILPICPYSVKSIVCGLSKIAIKDYIFGTAIGTLPGTIVSVSLTSSLNIKDNPLSILLTVIIFIAFNILIYLHSKKVRTNLE